MLDWYGKLRRTLSGMLPRLARWQPAGLTANQALWRSWEQSSRAVGLGLFGLSLFTGDGVVRPGSFAAGAALVVISWICAFYLGRLENRS